MVMAPGGGLGVSALGASFGDSVAAVGTKVTENLSLLGVPEQRPTMECRVADISVGSVDALDAYHTQYVGAGTPTIPAPQYATNWIMFSWDLARLTTLYGEPVESLTSVAIHVEYAVTMGGKISLTRPHFEAGTNQAHDLIAAVPPDVQVAAELDLHDVLGAPYPAGGLEYRQLAIDPTGGQRAWPRRPFPVGFGEGAWTRLATYHTTADIYWYPERAAGWWMVPVDLEKHVHKGKLVVVCAQSALFTQSDALCSELVQPFVANTEFATNERWGTFPLAYLNFGAGEGDREGRVHFFRGGPGEIPIGVHVADAGAAAPGTP